MMLFHGVLFHGVYTSAAIGDNNRSKMAQSKSKNAALLHELIGLARQMNVEVRTERLLREIGYHAQSGSCRLREKDLIILDKDSPPRDQVEFLAAELRERQSRLAALIVPPHLERLFKRP